jgi:glycosyltransferase involved in cell wall biosynthesis
MSATPPSLSDLPDSSTDKTGWPWTEQSDPLPAPQPDGTPWPKISIVTPSYNQGPFIEETIRSVLLQGYPNLEYVVIDGGSTDESVEILEKYDPWIDHWVSEPDDGQAEAINRGLTCCSGDLFNWVNSDDYLHPGALRAIAEGFADGADAVAGAVIDFCGEHTEWIFNRGLEPRYMLASSKHSKFHQPGVWLRLPLLEYVLPFNSSLRYCFDTELYVRYLRRFPHVEYVDEPLVYFRRHEDSKSTGEKESLDREFYRLKRRLMNNGFGEAREVFHREVEERRWHQVVNLVVDGHGSRLRRVAILFFLLAQKPYSRADRFFLSSLIRRVLLDGDA